MDDFADWFIEEVSEEDDASDFRDELRQSFATAFEFVVSEPHIWRGGQCAIC
jgi:hypothetical protein